MAGVIRPQNKQIIDPQTNRLTLEWDAYFARLEALAAGGSSGGVTTFEGRSGVVVSVAGDYTASEIDNDSGVAGAQVSDALDTLDGDIAGKQAADPTLASLAAFNTNGLLTQTAPDTFAGRTLTAPAAGLAISNPAGTAGNPTFALANDLAAVEGLSGAGLAVRTAADTWTTRTLTAPAAGIGVSNGDGVAGNPTLALANDLAALEGLGATGIAVRTAADTWAQRSVAGGTAITVTNGDGVSGNPSVAITASAVGTTQLTDNGVTNGKLADMAAWTLKLRNAGSSGDPSDAAVGDLTAATPIGGDFVVGYLSTGEIRKYDVDDLPGGGGGGGDLVLLASGTVSAAATLDIVLTAFTSYRALTFMLESFIPVTDDRELWMRVSTDGGASYDATGYRVTNGIAIDSNSSLFGQGATASNQITVCRSGTANESVSNVTAEGGAHAEVTLYDQTVSQFPKVYFRSTWFGAGGLTFSAFGGAARTTAQDTDAVRFLFETGNIASGKWALYGYV